MKKNIAMEKKVQESIISQRQPKPIYVPLIENSRTVEKKDKEGKTISTKKINQFKVAIPKPLSDAIMINKKDYEMEFILLNTGTLKDPQYILKAELKRKK